MIRRIKKHLSPGLVLSLIALVVAVGGTSFAVAQNARGQHTEDPARRGHHKCGPDRDLAPK